MDVVLQTMTGKNAVSGILSDNSGFHLYYEGRVAFLKVSGTTTIYAGAIRKTRDETLTALLKRHYQEA